MKKLLSLALAASALAGLISTSAPAFASDTKVMMPIKAALETDDAKAKLDGSVKLFFGATPTPKVLEKLGSDITSQKANAFGKAADAACNRAFLSDMMSLQKRAKELGANAVINIVSNYKHVEFSSETEFECHVGGLMVGAAFKADFVKIADK